MRTHAAAKTDENAKDAWRSATLSERASMPLAVSGRDAHNPSAARERWYRGGVEWQGRVVGTAWVAVVLAAGCGSSGAAGPADATADGAEDAPVDAPSSMAPEVDLCPGAHEPGCGVTSPKRVGDCLYMLLGEPQVPSNVAAYLVGDAGMMKIPRDPQDLDGWDYVDATFTSIRLYGSWCDEDRSGMFGTLTFEAGCSGCVP
jgi:hypothetical protein